MKNKNIWLNRGLSLLLVFMMIFSMMPLQVFAAHQGVNGGAGGADAVAIGSSVGNWGSELKKFSGMRFSLYFVEGDNIEHEDGVGKYRFDNKCGERFKDSIAN